MRQLGQWLIPTKAQIEQKIWRKLSGSRRFWKVTLTLILLCLTMRLLPYFAPIHASNLEQDQLAMEFTDRNGLPLGTLLTRDQQHTAVIPLNQVSPYFIQAILSAEDSGFYTHGALDIKAIARSIKEAIQARRIVSGASTITMQLARMLDPVPRTLEGKVREIWLSWRLTAGMKKEEILSAYINRLPMGGNIYGLEAGSRIYFSISADELNLAQASLLAALPNNPTYFNPYDHWERCKKRQAYVLNHMVQDGYITRPQADRAYTEKIALQPRKQGIIAAPHFLFWVANQLSNPSAQTPINPLNQNPKSSSVNGASLEKIGARQRSGSERASTIQNPLAPSKIRTTLDRPLQQFVEAQVEQVLHTLAPNNVHHAAVLVIDNRTSEVLAYVGSPNYFSEEKLGRNDGVQALRQPGSTLKPFLYELALENRVIHPNTVLADVPTYYAIPGAKLYRPTDYSEMFLGPVRVRVALANSLNVPAVRVLEKVGVQTFLNRLHQLGFEHLNKAPEHYGLGLILGSGEVSLWELTRAYLTLARQGQATLVTTFSPSKIPDSKSSSAIQNPKSEGALITNMLSDAHARAAAFGVESVLALPFPAAVKTGTSSDFRDTWTVGYTTDYTVATWVGNFNGDPMRQVSGVTGAAPLWNRIMLHLHATKEPAAFPPPERLVQRPVCALSGLKPTPACPSVVQEYFYLEDLSDYERQLDTFYQTVSQETDRESNFPSPNLKSEYRLNLPPEYDEWLEMQNLQTITSNGLKILSPRNGDVFLTYSAEASQSSHGENAAPQLEFKLANVSSQPVEWRLNGQKLATNSSNSLFWPLRPGDWTLQVKSADMSTQVNFQVQLSKQRSTRRGFSLANSPSTK